MIKKRFISMLVLLAAVATGARAAWTGGTYTATANENLGAITVNGDATLTINSDVTVTVTGGINVASGTLTVTGPGTLVVTGAKGTDGGTGGTDGGTGGTGGVAISGNIIVQGGATVTATGGTGGTGGHGIFNGGNAGNGGNAISGNIIVQGGATVTATGGTGGTGGTGDYGGAGGNGGNAFAGTLTYKSGTVTANGGSGGGGGWTEEEGYGPSGSAGKAFANDVDFTQTTGYSVTNGTSTIGSVLNQTKVVISGGTPTTVAVTGVTLAPTTATLTLGETETVTLIPTVLPNDATDKTVTWTTSNASVATVADGVVTAVAPGTATITATATNGTADTSDDKTATCAVTVSYPTYNLTANEETGNLSGLNDYKGKTCTVTYTRSFTAGKTSTVCLPFAYTKKEGDGSFYAFTNIEKVGSEYVATMTEPGTTTLTAGTPYLYLPNATGDVDFGGAYTIPAELTAGETTSNGWTFKGTFETIEWKEAPTGTYGFSAQSADGISQGQFVKVGNYVRIKPMRCYLKYKNGAEDYAGARAVSANEQLPETIKVRLVSANGDVNAIGTISTKTGEGTIDNGAWYSLDGRRIEGKPSTKGVYINNGNKVIIK